MRIDHPFHIHINPFQVVEVFDPNEMVVNAAGQRINKYVFGTKQDPIQCELDPTNSNTWQPCDKDKGKKSDYIWRDVFPIPSGRRVPGSQEVVPGYFKMRSRFVDYPGWFVMHCHILAHEDRGMMTVVHVAPFTPPVSHH
jgi:FtsP/CotA-like multicopper oxidase with cupredoxin domain